MTSETFRRIRFWSIVVAAILLVVVILQNDRDVELRILLWKAEASQLWVLPTFLAIGFVAGFFAGWASARRRLPDERRP